MLSSLPPLSAPLRPLQAGACSSCGHTVPGATGPRCMHFTLWCHWRASGCLRELLSQHLPPEQSQASRWEADTLAWGDGGGNVALFSLPGLPSWCLLLPAFPSAGVYGRGRGRELSRSRAFPSPCALAGTGLQPICCPRLRSTQSRRPGSGRGREGKPDSLRPAERPARPSPHMLGGCAFGVLITVPCLLLTHSWMPAPAQGRLGEGPPWG